MAVCFAFLAFCQEAIMKSVANTAFWNSIKTDELNTCSYLRRNHDIALGSTQELYFCMQYVGHYICRKEFLIEKRQLDNSVLLLLTISGEGKLYYKNSEYALTKGMCMLIDARNVHEYHAVGDDWEFKYLHFWGAMSEKYISYIEDHSVPVFMFADDELSRMIRTLDRILDMTEEAIISDYPMISRLIYTLIMLWLSHDNNKDGIESMGINAMSEALAYIRQNYTQSISTEDIAQAVSLSRSYMSELFKHTYGISPHEYVIQFRLSVAKNMLLNTALSITEIAERTGFRDIFAFSRIFKREIGISPVQYRHKHNKIK